VGEGLSVSEIGKEVAEHAKESQEGAQNGRRDHVMSVVEAVLLATVAVMAAWSGYASAKWSTESRLQLAQASTARTEASRAALDATSTKDFDAATFNAWFSAYIAGDQEAMALAARRFRPEFRVAFDAWMATSPSTNPDSPPGPSYMPEYQQPELAKAGELDARATELYATGAQDGGNADDYVRITVYLATVLFIVGISGHFRFRASRIGLVVVGSSILAYCVVLLLQAPKPPG
jgi:hypothetical protein